MNIEHTYDTSLSDMLKWIICDDNEMVKRLHQKKIKENKNK